MLPSGQLDACRSTTTHYLEGQWAIGPQPDQKLLGKFQVRLIVDVRRYSEETQLQWASGSGA